MNRTWRYSYLSYDFANRSSDVLDRSEDTCSAVGADCRCYERHIRVHRRTSVALLLDHVGLKA